MCCAHMHEDLRVLPSESLERLEENNLIKKPADVKMFRFEEQGRSFY